MPTCKTCVTWIPEPEARDVHCPSCDANPGRCCRSTTQFGGAPSGKPVPDHGPRKKAAETAPIRCIKCDVDLRALELRSFTIRYRDRDPACPVFVAKVTAYHEAHARETFLEGPPDSDWTIISVLPTPSAR